MSIIKDSFNNFKDIKLGKVEDKHNEIKIKDYIEYKNSNALGRIFTQIKLACKGKGWLNDQSALKLIQNMDWNTIEKVHSQSESILKKNEELRKYTKKPGTHHLAGDDFTNEIVVSKEEYKKEIKRLKKEDKIALAIKQLVEANIDEKEGQYHTELKPLEKLSFNEIKINPKLGPDFKKYLAFLTDTPDRSWRSENTLHHEYRTIEFAHQVITTQGRRFNQEGRSLLPNELLANTFKREIDFDRLNPLDKQEIVRGFKEYLVERKVENKLSQSEWDILVKEVSINIGAMLDKKIQNPEMEVFGLKGHQVLVQVMAKMNSFWEEVEGEGGENKVVEITDPQTRLELTKNRIEYLKSTFSEEEYEPLLRMLEIIAAKNLENDKSISVAKALNHFFDDNTLAGCKDGKEIYNLIKETFNAITG